VNKFYLHFKQLISAVIYFRYWKLRLPGLCRT